MATWNAVVTISTGVLHSDGAFELRDSQRILTGMFSSEDSRYPKIELQSYQCQFVC